MGDIASGSGTFWQGDKEGRKNTSIGEREGSFLSQHTHEPKARQTPNLLIFRFTMSSLLHVLHISIIQKFGLRFVEPSVLLSISISDIINIIVNGKGEKRGIVISNCCVIEFVIFRFKHSCSAVLRTQCVT